MSISPCAMLMTRMTPKVMARPNAARIRMELKLRQLNSVSVTSTMTRRTPGEEGVRPPAGPGGAGRTDGCGPSLADDLDLLALGDAALGPVAVPALEDLLRVRLGLDDAGLVDDV